MGVRTGGEGAKRHRRRRDGQRGAVLVEFGLIALLLFTLIFGIVEFGWAYAQTLDVRHGAREGARLAAVNHANGTTPDTSQTQAIVTATCNRLDDNGQTRNVRIKITLNGSAIGDSVTVQIRSDLETLTGFFPFLENNELNSTVELRLEQKATYADTASVPGALGGADAGFLSCT